MSTGKEKTATGMGLTNKLEGNNESFLKKGEKYMT